MGVTQPNTIRSENRAQLSTARCCNVPLDIAMLGFALVDIVYFALFSLLCWIILSQEIFEAKDDRLIKGNVANKNKDFANFTPSPPVELKLNVSSFGERTSIAPLLFPDYLDRMEEARGFCKIAKNTLKLGYDSIVDNKFGRRYYYEFLIGNELDITRILFGTLIAKAILASSLFAATGCALVMIIVFFRGSMVARGLTIILWNLQLVPILIICQAIVISQSKRFCILQFGIGINTRGQDIMAGVLLWPLVLYKPYEIYVWGLYTKTILTNSHSRLHSEMDSIRDKRKKIHRLV